MLDMRRYLQVLIGVGITASAAVLAAAIVLGYLPENVWPMRCTATGYGPDRYLGYCADRAYGVYDKGALWIPTEPAAVTHLKRAKVLFLGNSRSKRAFSTQAVRDYAARTGRPVYNLGFSGEYDLFPQRLIERYDLWPDIVVANVDYFFYGTLQVTAAPLVGGDPVTLSLYRAKRWAQKVHLDLCAVPEGWLARALCGTRPAQFRSVVDGVAEYLNWDDEVRNAIALADSFPQDIYPALRRQAERFAAAMAKRNICLVLTFVPTSDRTPAVARRLANDLGLPFMYPGIAGATTYDRSHMSPSGAERWSAAFLSLLEKTPDPCVMLGAKKGG